MKKRTAKVFALALTFALAMPALPFAGQPITAIAATKRVAVPRLSVTKKILIGLRQKYKIGIINKNYDCTYIWSSSNPKAVSVDFDGTVTTEGPGKSTITCRVYYPNGNVRTLKCVVTTRIRATGIKINNAGIGDNNAREMSPGDSFNFNTTLTPKNSTYNTYWSIDNKNIATVDKNGVVKIKESAVEDSVVRLTAKAAVNQNNAARSEIKNTINIIIKQKTAKVVGHPKFSGSNTINIVFSQPIDASTVINTNTRVLTENILVGMTKDKNGVMANNPGVLKGEFSTDGKTLTITSENDLKGTYRIRVLAGVKTIEKASVVPFDESIKMEDSEKPRYVNTTVTEDGLRASINFSESIDISLLKIVSWPTDGSVSSMTQSILMTPSSYTLSTDKKSIIVDLSSIPLSDRNKSFNISLSGIRDAAGNYSNPYVVPVIVKTDTSTKPQPQIISLKRTSYNEITVVFDRPVLDPGMIKVADNTSTFYGVVDAADNKKVRYNFDSEIGKLYGMQTVYIGWWSGYNTVSSDVSTRYWHTMAVDFTIDNEMPYILNSSVSVVDNGTIKNYIISLIYNKPISLLMPSGSLNATVTDTAGNIIPNQSIPYLAAVAPGNIITLTVTSNNMPKDGIYEITIPDKFVMDAEGKYSSGAKISVPRSADGTELPAPYLIHAEEGNKVLVEFSSKLDKNSAETISNYYITGIASNAIESAVLTSNENYGATVTLQLRKGSISETKDYPVSVRNIKGYGGYQIVKDLTQQTYLYDNTPPKVLSAVRTDKYRIMVTFNEAISGEVTFTIAYGNKSQLLTSYGDGVNKKIEFYLPYEFYEVNPLKLIAVPNSFHDVQYNSNDSAAIDVY